MQTIGYDIVNLGERELAGGVERFLSLTKQSKLLFTNANFVYRDKGEPFVAPFVLREVKTRSGRVLKIGFIGLDALNSSFAKETAGGRVVVMREPVDAARALIPALRARSDLVVLLANLSLRDLTTVLSAVKGVDLALVSYGSRLSDSGKLESVAGVPTLYAGDQGKRMGEVRIRLSQKAEPPSMMSGQVFLTRRYPSVPALQSLIDRTIAQVNELNKEKAQRASAAIVTSGVPVAPNAGGASEGGIASRAYLTATTCQTCHIKEGAVYAASGHAHAFETLVKVNQDFNAECLKCHVTGFGRPEGFLNPHLTPDLVNVQCEACHGAAAEHVADLQKPFGAVPPRNCFECHTKENSPDFVFYKYWDQIKH